MKQVTYEIRGLVIETMIPAIITSCESLPEVRNVRVTVKETDSALLILTIEGSITGELNDSLRSIMVAKGLELVTPPSVDTPAAFRPVHVPHTEGSVPLPSGRPTAVQPAPTAPFDGGKRVSLTAALSTVILSVVLAVLLTFSLTVNHMKNSVTTAVTPAPDPEAEALASRLMIIDRIFQSYGVMYPNMDDQSFMEAVMDSYVAATGDVYAKYYSAEEYQARMDAYNGKVCGIGVTIKEDTVSYGGKDYRVVSVVDVYAGSPAEAAGILPGDCIFRVGAGDEQVSVHDVGYTKAVELMKGDVGTACTITILRPVVGDSASIAYEEMEITAIRAEFTSRSVVYRVYSEDETVGVIRLKGFDYTTRDQLVEAIDTLQEQGCQSFVFDLRGNPGGLLASVEDVLVFFLQADDVIHIDNYVDGKQLTTYVSYNRAGNVLCGTGELTVEDIGKYRDLNFSVLVNGDSASASELFTSAIRDYELATIVGTTTYGKGVGQSSKNLSTFGFENGGYLKLTTFYYCPPCGENFHGVGVTPHVVVELSEEAQQYSIGLLPDKLDNQLAAAVEALK